jgi:hypothetical protein
MIVDELKRFTRKVLVDIVSGLVGCKMRRRRPVFTQRFLVQCEERSIVTQRTLEPPPASVARTEVIAHIQQFRGG